MKKLVKKLFSAFLATVVAVTTVATSVTVFAEDATAEASLRASVTEVSAGDEVEITLAFSNAHPMRTIEYDIAYPAGFELESAAYNATLKSFESTLTNNPLNGAGTTALVSWTTMDTVNASPAEFDFVTLVFKVTDEAAVGNNTFTAMYSDGYYYTYEDPTGFAVLANDASVTVEVVKNVTGVTLDKDTISLEKGDTDTLTATVTPSDATDKSVTWSSANPGVATVDNTGKVTAVSKGTTTIKVTTTDGSYTDTCSVTVTVPATGVNIDKSAVSVNVGSTTTLVATVDPEDVSDATVVWSSADVAIATVDQTGKVTAVAKGSTTITVTTNDGSFTDTCEVTVTVPVTGVEILGGSEEVSIPKGVTTTPIPIEVFPADADNQYVTYESLNPSVATIAADGCVTTIAAGTAVIKVTTVDGGFTDTINLIVVVPVTGVSLNQPTLDLGLGNSVTLTPEITPADATDKAVTWESSDDTVVSVDANGKITALADGTATITVTTNDNGYTDTCVVTVVVPVTGVTLDKTALTLEEGQTGTLTATVEPDEADNKNVTWSSSDDRVATVDATGKVTAVNAGIATITVTTEDGAKTAVCNVTVIAKVTGVTLDKTTYDLGLGNSVTLTPTIAPEDATDKSVTWSSSDDTVVSVDANGKITALADGTATITVKTVDGGFTATCVVSVVVPVTGVTLDKTALTLEEGQTGTLTATVEPDEADNKNITWSSSDETVATVDATGKVTAVNAGTATITVTTEDGNKTAVCNVTVIAKVTGVTLDKTAIEVLVGRNDTLTATIAPEDATEKSVTWTTSDAAVATVDANGKVTAVAVGTATITVKTTDGGFTATCTVTVKPVACEGITLSQTSGKIYIGESITLTATLTPADTTNKNVTWTSSDESIATVDANGKVTAVAEGTATITATTEDGGFTATFTATVEKKPIVSSGNVTPDGTVTITPDGELIIPGDDDTDTPAGDDTTTPDDGQSPDSNPDMGSVAPFAALTLAATAAFVISKKRK